MIQLFLKTQKEKKSSNFFFESSSAPILWIKDLKYEKGFACVRYVPSATEVQANLVNL